MDAQPNRSANALTVDEVRRYCLAKRGVTEGRPFGPNVLVLKVHRKVFAIIGDALQPPTLSLKAEPDFAAALRATYTAVAPGYHLNKRHWNTVTLDATVPVDEVLSWIDDSYDLVMAGLPKRVQRLLAE